MILNPIGQILAFIAPYIPELSWGDRTENEYEESNRIVLSFWHPKKQAAWILLSNETYFKGRVIFAYIMWELWPKYFMNKWKEGFQKEYARKKQERRKRKRNDSRIVLDKRKIQKSIILRLFDSDRLYAILERLKTIASVH